MRRSILEGGGLPGGALGQRGTTSRLGRVGGGDGAIAAAEQREVAVAVVLTLLVSGCSCVWSTCR